MTKRWAIRGTVQIRRTRLRSKVFSLGKIFKKLGWKGQKILGSKKIFDQ